MIKKTLHDCRRNMVVAVRQGRPHRQVATEFGVALSTLQWWLTQVGIDPLDQVDGAPTPEPQNESTIARPRR
jgi:transposase